MKAPSWRAVVIAAKKRGYFTSNERTLSGEYCSCATAEIAALAGRSCYELPKIGRSVSGPMENYTKIAIDNIEGFDNLSMLFWWHVMKNDPDAALAVLDRMEQLAEQHAEEIAGLTAVDNALAKFELCVVF